MSIDILKQAGFFVLLCIAQVLVLNHINLFGCATPLLYVYMAIVFPLNYPKWASLLWCFALGMAIDTFSNTPGMSAASLTLVAAVQPYYSRLFTPQDAPEDLRPSFLSFDPTKFTFFVTTLVLLHSIAFFTLEAFSFFNWQQWLLNIGGCTVLTTLLILTIESVRKK